MASRYRTKGVGQLPGTPAYKGAFDTIGMMGNVVLVNWSSHTRKNFYENCSQCGPVPWKNFASPVVAPPPKKKSRGAKWLPAQIAYMSRADPVSSSFLPVQSQRGFTLSWQVLCAYPECHQENSGVAPQIRVASYALTTRFLILNIHWPDVISNEETLEKDWGNWDIHTN